MYGGVPQKVRKVPKNINFGAMNAFPLPIQMLNVNMHFSVNVMCECAKLHKTNANASKNGNMVVFG